MSANSFKRMHNRIIAMTAMVASLSLAQSISAVEATGGNTTNDIDGYRIHTFTNSATASNFVVTATGNVEVLVVAGGGGGGGSTNAGSWTGGGGGGAGGLWTGTTNIASGSFNVVVGAGGAGGAAGAPGVNGSNSVFGGVIAYGGGGGGRGGIGTAPERIGLGGGSGGGSGYLSTTGGSRTNGQGRAGGYSGASDGPGSGGGGGAGAVGGNGLSSPLLYTGGTGGVGVASAITGTTSYYAGGGGAGGLGGYGNAGDGGLGGGGNGAKFPTTAAQAGTPNTGGGGGGGTRVNLSQGNNPGGAGGAGIVIVRYILDPDLPRVANGAAVNFRWNSADLVGSLTSTGTSPTTVYAFWSTNDCTTNEAAWLANGGSANLGPRVQGVTFTNTASGLIPNTFYYFNFMASNTTGKAWGASAGSPSFWAGWATGIGGNTTNDSGGYRIHTFTNSATASNFVVTAGGNVEVLVVAGGGGGGSTIGGGGGAGGLIYTNSLALVAGTNMVIVGAGGAGAVVGGNSKGSMGSNSVFGILIAYGGGGAGSWGTGAGLSGGSGGGASGNAVTSAGLGTNGQGNAGGTNIATNAGGGGGGAGSVGTNATSTKSGMGGTGKAYDISGVSKFYAGGGGGGARSGSVATSDAGGNGGGGSGATDSVGSNGVANTGGGGGGGGFVNPTYYAGGNGGAGIVIVRYIIDPNLPRVANGAAVNLQLNSADLVGSLNSTGTSPTTVYAFWATNDCTTNEATWLANGGSSNFGPRVQGETFTNSVGGLAGDTLFYFNFMASNTTGKAWGTAAGSPSFRTLTLPVVNNSTGATAVGQYSATLNGNLTTGMTAYVYMYWWTNNASVSNVIDFGAARSHGLFSTNLTGLDWGTLYNYQCFASNAAGTAWAGAASNFTTLTPSFRYVTPTGAGTFSGADWVNAASNVQDAITACVGQVSEIYLKSGIYSNTSQLVISNHPGMTIRGGYVGSGTPGDTGSAPTILTRNTANNIRIIYGTNSTLTLDSITVSNGYASAGAGLYLIACTTTVANCSLLKNGSPARSDGCGIYLSAGSLTVTNSSFVKNGPTTAPGWTAGYGGAIYADRNPTVVLLDTLFDGNGISGYDYTSGGCLYISGGNLQVRNCRFVGNYLAAYYASGLLDLRGLASLAISGCVFSNNTVSINLGGGLIYLGGAGASGVRISDNTLIGNTATATIWENFSSGGQLSIQGCVLKNNPAIGIYKTGSSTLTVSNCLIEGQNQHGMSLTAGTASILNSTLTANLKWGVTNSAAAVTMRDTIVWNNTLGGVGGAVTATYCDSQNALSGSGNISEDPLFVPDYYLSASDLQGVNSPCVNAGSALASALGLGSTPYTTRTDGGADTDQVDMGYHYTNGIGGAAIYLTLYVDAVNGNNSNVGDAAGAPLKTITAALGKISAGGTVHVATGTYNTALGETLPLVLGKNNLKIKGTNHQNTIVNGGGSNQLLTASYKGSVWLEGLTFTNGYALSGSGLYLDTCQTTITNCVLARNGRFTSSVTIYGGAIYASGGYLTVLNSELTGNGSPVLADWNGTRGGAIWADGTAVTLDKCLFRANEMRGYTAGGGGCLYFNAGSANIRNCQFIDNYSRTHNTGLGVLYLSGQTALSISNCLFSGNTKYGWSACGVVTVNGTASGVEMVGCTFTSNSIAHVDGGMVQVAKIGGSMRIRDTIIGRNSGNGIWLAGASALGVTNSLIHSQTNHGVLVTAGTASLSSLTIANNKQWGVTNSTGAVTVKNSVVWGNTLGGIKNATVNYTDSQEVNAGTENLNTDPLFKDAGVFDFSLKPSSPCVNKGDNESWMETGLDLAGGKRMIAARVDMGAFESSGLRGSILTIR